MTGLYDMLGQTSLLSSFEDHSNSHAVIDGSNLQYFFSLRNHALSDFPGYEKAVRNFFQHLLDAGITPHVFFDGPARNDAQKWERGRIRRQERLEKLVHGTTNFRVLDYPQPTAIVDVFRNVLHSLGIRSIQMSAKRDYTHEMVTHAKYLNAFLISGNAKFFVEDIPGGFVFLQREQFGGLGFKLDRRMKTFRFQKLSELVNLEDSPNQYALIMWAVVLFNRKTFELFSKPFFGKANRRPEYYPESSPHWLRRLLPDANRRLPSFKMLQFFLENTRADAERMLREQLFAGERKEATLLFEESISAQLVEPYDVFKKIESEIETGAFCDQEPPKWFLRYLTVECKLLPVMMDILTDCRHHLASLLEDFKKQSVNESTLHLRRIIYGILIPESENRNGIVKVIELDRSGISLKETERTPTRVLWDPENPSDTREVPSLKEMEALPEHERTLLFLLSMGVEKSSLRGINSKKTQYILVVLRYWIVANDDVERKDLLRILLTALMVEQEYSKPSNIFAMPVKLKKDARSVLGVRFHPDSVAQERESFACMHPLAQLQNSMLFGKILHRLLMEPLGSGVDSIEAITSEVAFYHIYRRSQPLDDDELKCLIKDVMDEESENNFWNTVDYLWNENAIKKGRDTLRDSRGAGDDGRRCVT